MNRITIIGNVGKEPTIKAFSETHGVTNFSVATVERWLGKDKQWQSKTTWHNVTAWQNVKLPELNKGDKVLVEGKMTYNINEQTKQCYPSIVAAEVYKINKANDKNNYEPIKNEQLDFIESSTNDSDNVPF